MKIFAFVFARGGSKGLPGKNIKKLSGKPLIQYSIEIAKALRSIDKIFVSTDDAAIAEIALQLGAIVIPRPLELGKDDTPEWLAWRHAILWCQSHYGVFDYFVSLPATSPLRSECDVENAIKKIQSEQADMCIAITQSSRSPYFNMVKINSAGCLELACKADSEVTRRQDAPPVFDITTVVYVGLPKFILDKYGIFSGKLVSIEVPRVRAIDIDDIYDFKLAEAIIAGDA